MSSPGDRREPPAETKCLPAAQLRQAKRACNYNVNKTIPSYQNLINVCVYIVYIYIYICNELIKETAGYLKLIFGMWGSFGYVLSSDENVGSSWNYSLLSPFV